MKALIYTGPESLSFGETPEPTAPTGEVVVDVESCGICGSDMHAYLGHDERRPAPLILGHEVAGRRRDTGARVTVNPLVGCGTCGYCTSGHENLCQKRQIISLPPREGGFAESIVIPERNLVIIPDQVSDDQAALAEPIACGWHAVRLALGYLPDAKRALAIGGGAIGLGAALSAQAQGIEEVVLSEPSQVRRDFIASKCSIDVLAPDDPSLTTGFDIVIDGVGFPATRAQASALVRPGGVILHIGLGSAEGGLDIRRMTLQEIAFIGTYTYTAQDFRDTAAAMFNGRLGSLDWTEERPLAEGARAFSDIRAGTVPAPKIILKP